MPFSTVLICYQVLDSKLMLKVQNLKLMLEQQAHGVSEFADSVSFLLVYARMSLSVLTMGSSVVVVDAMSSN